MTCRPMQTQLHPTQDNKSVDVHLHKVHDSTFTRRTPPQDSPGLSFDFDCTHVLVVLSIALPWACVFSFLSFAVKREQQKGMRRVHWTDLGPYSRQ